MSHISFADYIVFIENHRNRILQRIDSGEGVYVSDLENFIRQINYVLHNLPVGTTEEGVPPGSYNWLVEIRDVAQRTLDRSIERQQNELQQNAGKKRKSIRKTKNRNKKGRSLRRK